MSTQLAAKVLKRAGQVRRLGGRGLVRTAYVRTLGPSVYSLTEPARSIATVLHRRKALTRALSSRLALLKVRARALRDEAATGVRHGFGTNVGQFVQTLEAMLDLQECAVPRILKVDWASHAIICEAVNAKPFSDRDGAVD